MSLSPESPLLLVEDDWDMAGNIADYLGARHWEVQHAANGALALHLLQSERFEVVILDRDLPVIDGLEVCRRLRQGPARRVPVLMLTAAEQKNAALLVSLYPDVSAKLTAIESQLNDSDIKAIRTHLDQLLALASKNELASLEAEAAALKTSFVKVYLQRG